MARRDAGMSAKRVAFSQATLLEVPEGSTVTYYNMEKELKGEFIKYSNNVGYVNTKEYATTLQVCCEWV